MREYNILIVDTDEENKALIELYLAEEGFHVFSETNPRNVLQQIEKHHIQIVICEIKLQGISGLRLLEQIKAHDGAIQVIMTSGFVKISDILACRNAGAVGFLFKPYENIPDFLQEIHDAKAQIEKWNTILMKRKNYSVILTKKGEK